MDIIKEFTTCSPHIVLTNNSANITPIDLLQDCKAVSKGPRWERADIACDFLRSVALQLYKSQKVMCEKRGCRKPEGSIAASNISSEPSLVSSSNSSSLSSRATTLLGVQSDGLDSSYYGLCTDSQQDNYFED
eukprot:CAMPEP_0197247750 /NCGR_PEP_ID=MMETSP1429-20130617/31912_1 /TAXON_ID=49237 /ORGANISM="Chaetoceros  sp., Strain UNC1202" /LENGTH=132 /DNA_ID=CAMNT_0042708747 /DNA_START=1 /DNA_END=399 /DNA_ORIENTATION=-